MAFRYTIPEISAITLLSAIEEKDGKFDIVYDAAEPLREYLVKWTRQDDCPMFHQAMRILKGDGHIGYRDVDAFSEVFLYVDFSGIFDCRPVGKVADLQRKAEWMFRPEGIRLCLRVQTHRYIAFERSASMSRNSKLCFVREDVYEPLKERMMLGMTIGECQLSKLYAYNGLLFTGGWRIDSSGLLNDKRIIVIDNPKSIVPNVQTITVEDDGSDAPVREYHRMEKRMDDAQIKADFNELYRQMNGMPLRKMDKIIYPVCTLCRDHEKSGFISGIQTGFVLSDELMG